MNITYSKTHPFINMKLYSDNQFEQSVEKSKFIYYSNLQLHKMKLNHQEEIRKLKDTILPQASKVKASHTHLEFKQRIMQTTKRICKDQQNSKKQNSPKVQRPGLQQPKITQFVSKKQHHKTFTKVTVLPDPTNSIEQKIHQKLSMFQTRDESIHLTSNDLSFDSNTQENQQSQSLWDGFSVDISSCSSNNSLDPDEVFRKIKISEFMKTEHIKN